MGNFEEHIEYGVYSFIGAVIVSLGLAYVFAWPYQLLIALIPFSLSATLLGSLTPDIDHHNSHPHKTIKNVVPLVIVSLQLSAIYLYFTKIYTSIQSFIMIDQAILAFVGFLFSVSVGILVRYSITVFRPSHRGITHSHSFNLFVSILLFVGVYTVFSAVGLTATILYSASTVVSLSFGVGFLSHQYCDNMLF